MPWVCVVSLTGILSVLRPSVQTTDYSRYMVLKGKSTSIAHVYEVPVKSTIECGTRCLQDLYCSSAAYKKSTSSCLINEIGRTNRGCVKIDTELILLMPYWEVMIVCQTEMNYTCVLIFFPFVTQQ